MKIHFVKNAWGHCMPVYFDKCCDAMTLKYSPETKPFNGYWMNPYDQILFIIENGEINGVVKNCPFCDAKIELIQRELKSL